MIFVVVACWVVIALSAGALALAGKRREAVGVAATLVPLIVGYTFAT